MALTPDYHFRSGFGRLPSLRAQFWARAKIRYLFSEVWSFIVWDACASYTILKSEEVAFLQY